MAGLPSAIYLTQFEHCDYRLALCWQLGLPLLPADTMGEKCAQCGLCLDAFGDHAVSCKGNGITVRHGVIQDWLLARAREAGIACTREGGLDDHTRPADVLLHSWAGQGPLAVDVTCVNPLRPSEARPPPDRVRKFLLDEEQRKMAKYRRQCLDRGWDFMPLVTHPFAGTTSLGGQFLHRLSRLYAENTSGMASKSELIQLFWQTYSCAIMMQVACQLRLTTYTGPQPITLNPLPWVDKAGNEFPRILRARSQEDNCLRSGRPLVATIGHGPWRSPVRAGISTTGRRASSATREPSRAPYGEGVASSSTAALPHAVHHPYSR
jgi:hypothetical protein